MRQLPTELLRHIVGLVESHIELSTLACVCTTFQTLCADPAVWRELCFRQYPFRDVASLAAAADIVRSNDERWPAIHAQLLARSSRTRPFALLFRKQDGTLRWGPVDQGNAIIPPKLIELLTF